MTATTKTGPGACSIVTVESRLTAAAKAMVRMDEIPQTERALRRKIDAALRTLEVGPLGPTFTLWRPPMDGRLDLEPGVVVSRAFEPVGEVVPSSLPGGRTAHVVLAGPFDGLPGAWNTLLSWCTGQDLKLAGINWQIYGDEGGDAAEMKTSLHALLA